MRMGVSTSRATKLDSEIYILDHDYLITFEAQFMNTMKHHRASDTSVLSSEQVAKVGLSESAIGGY